MKVAFYSNSFHPELNEACKSFVSRRIPALSGDFGPGCTMAVYDEGVQVAGVVFHNYYPERGTIELSSASDDPRWLSRRVLRAMFNVPFDILGCQAIIARHGVEAKHLRRMWTRVGAEEYIIPRLRGKDLPDEVITVLTDDAWRSSSFYGVGING